MEAVNLAHHRVKAPRGELTDDRQGLTICDATSAVFAMELP